MVGIPTKANVRTKTVKLDNKQPKKKSETHKEEATKCHTQQQQNIQTQAITRTTTSSVASEHMNIIIKNERIFTFFRKGE